MRKIVFFCNSDDCKKEIGNKKHITLMLGGGPGTGIAIPPAKDGGSWHTVALPAHWIHFCGAPCLAHYFKILMENAK